MSNFILIAVCIVAGYLFKRRGLLPENAHKSINVWIVYIALPAVSFKYLPHLKWSTEMLVPALAPVVICLMGLLYIQLYAKIKPINKLTKGGLQMMTGMSNTSFVGFPLILAYFRESDLSIAIICDQVTFLLFSSVGLVIAVSAQGETKITAKKVLHKLLLFPPFIGCLLALSIPKMVDLSPLEPLFSSLASTVAPLALFSIGLQLSFNGWRKELEHIGTVLLYKLILAPLMITGILVLLHIKGPVAKITAFEAAMPVLLSAGILADEYDLNPKLCSLVIGISIVVSMITTALWFYILNSVA